ncbi:hypothetical protein QAD02_023997 [Eretmocerus hayati]|uniref:Uncharacterized protein n=1 Tax=Eretmocerus hayati TaxID=131215 RepID=A0ACC2PXS5_9HYME|nr:hypothetical protein QAD02_023997 [Eretmocerus hayati]
MSTHKDMGLFTQQESSEPDTHSFSWTLTNACLQQVERVGDRIDSVKFKTRFTKNLEPVWRLRIYPKGRPGEGPNRVPIFLVSKNRPRTEVNFNLKVELKSELKSELVLQHNRGKQTFHYNSERGDGSLDRNVVFDEMYNFLKGNHLSIQCSILPAPPGQQDPHSDEIQSSGSCLLVDSSRSTCFGSSSSGNELKRDSDEVMSALDKDGKSDSDLMKLLEDELFGDSEIKVNGKIYRVHENTLGDQSPVLAQMIRDAKRTEHQVVVIGDLDNRVFEEMLRFAYFNKIGRIEHMVGDLFAAAEKYDLDKLKVVLEAEAGRRLSIENAIEFLNLSDRHQLSRLKKKVVDFIAYNSKDMLEVPAYRQIAELSEPGTVFEVITALTMRL